MHFCAYYTFFILLEVIMPALSLDIAVIGGGPGGLAAALAIRRASPGLTLKVFERSTATQPRGAGISLEVNGLKALEGISPDAYSTVMKNSVHFSTMATVDVQGKLLYERDMRELDAQYGKQNVAIGWWELTNCLMQHLPPETVVVGRKYDRLVVADGVDILFQGDPSPVHAQVVIGCDGGHSKVWQQALGLPPPTFCETYFWRARVPKAALPPCEMQPMTYVGGGLLAVVFPISSGDVVWALGTPAAELESRGIGDVAQYDGMQRIQHCQRMVENYPALLRDCIAATDPDSILVHKLWARDPDDVPCDRLGDGPVTVLGDAFHPMRPVGQGVSCALEDAVVLGKCIAERGPCAAALRAYERERIPRVKLIMASTLASGRAAYERDASKIKATWPDVAGALDLKAADWPDLGAVADAQKRLRQEASGGKKG